MKRRSNLKILRIYQADSITTSIPLHDYESAGALAETLEDVFTGGINVLGISVEEVYEPTPEEKEEAKAKTGRKPSTQTLSVQSIGAADTPKKPPNGRRKKKE
jgi:hypothetical protein